MDIKTIEDAILLKFGTAYPDFKVVERADNMDKTELSLPAFFLNLDKVQLSEHDNPDFTCLVADFSALIIFRNTEKATLSQNLAGYIDFINRNSWGIGVTEAFFAGAERVELAPERKDLYVWQINFSHEFSV